MWDIYRDFEEDQLGPLEEEFDEEEIPEQILRLVRLQFHAMHGFIVWSSIPLIFQFLKDHLTFFCFYQTR